MSGGARRGGEWTRVQPASRQASEISQLLPTSSAVGQADQTVFRRHPDRLTKTPSPNTKNKSRNSLIMNLASRQAALSGRRSAWPDSLESHPAEKGRWLRRAIVIG